MNDRGTGVVISTMPLTLLLYPFLFFCGFIPVSHGAQFTKFRSYEDDNFSDVRYIYDRGRVQWSASSPSMQRIILIGHQRITITLNCQVDSLDSENILKYMDFQFSTSSHIYLPLWYTTLHSRKKQEVFKIGRHRNFSANLSFDEREGGMATLSDIPPHVSLDDIGFKCVACNKRGKVTSNSVEIFDYRNHFPEKVWTPPHNMTFAEERPGQLECLARPPKLHSLVVLPFRWAACSHTGRPDSCRPIDAVKLRWPIQVLPSGALYWPFVTPQARAEMQGKTLRCSIKDQTLAIYQNKLNFYSLEDRKLSLRLYRPKLADQVKLFNHHETDVILPVMMEGERNITQWEWKYNGSLLHFKEDSTTGCFLLHRDVPLIRCKGPFSQKDYGNYALNVGEDRRNSRTRRTVKFYDGLYRVASNGFPKLSSDMVKQIFVLNGSDAEVTCQFERRNEVFPSLKILGYDIDFDSHQSIGNSVSEINSYVKDVMIPLKAAVNVARPKRGFNLTYIVKEMVYESKNWSSSHYIQCIGYNGNYTVRQQTFLTVFPRPEFAVNGTPSDSTCDGCARQVVQCIVVNRAEIEGTSLEVRISWLIRRSSGKGVDDVADTSNDRSRITIDLSAGKWDEDLNVTCVVEVMRRDTRSLVYSSSADEGLESKLIVKIQIAKLKSNVTPIIWSCTLILAVLVLVILAIVFKPWRKYKNCLKMKKRDEREDNASLHLVKRPTETADV